MLPARVLFGGLLLLLSAGSARAAELKLEFHDGRVTLVARDVSVRQILSEWARVGRTRIVNGERTSATPVTLQIDGLPERRALDVVLRSAAGYMAAPRRADNPGPSRYDRILVLAVSTPPAATNRPSTPAAFPTPRTAAPTVLQPPGPLLLPEDVGPAPDEDEPGAPLRSQPGLAPGPPSAPGTPPPAVPPFPRVPGSTSRPTTVPGGTSVPGVMLPQTPPPDRPGTDR